jgi:hypothetical protein
VGFWNIFKLPPTLVLSIVTRKVHGNQGMKQLGLEIIKGVSRREKVKRLEFMNESLWEELKRITKVSFLRKESFKKKGKKKKELKKFEENFEKKI